MKTTLHLLTKSPIHGEKVLLAFVGESKNEKTGDMVQVHILHPEYHPLEAQQNGCDDLVCGNCPQRPILGGKCYVETGKGPASTWKAWIKQGKPQADTEDVLALCADRYVRFGAYGDPAHIDRTLVQLILSVASGHTAYTHQWRNPIASATWRGLAMASCEAISHVKTAKDRGWSAFIACAPNHALNVQTCANETSGIRCIDCMACDGSNGHVRVTPHGFRVGNK